MNAELNDFIKVKGRFNNYLWYRVLQIEDTLYLCNTIKSPKDSPLVSISQSKVLEVKKEDVLIREFNLKKENI